MTDLTLKEFLDHWVRDHRERRPSTVADLLLVIEDHMRKHLTDRLGPQQGVGLVEMLNHDHVVAAREDRYRVVIDTTPSSATLELGLDPEGLHEHEERS